MMPQRAAAGFVNYELRGAFIDPDTIKMRITCPRNSEIYRYVYLTADQVAAISALREKRNKKFGRGRHTNTVLELPDELRGDEAIPALMAEILGRVEEGQPLEEMRKQGILDISQWSIDALY
jgi:hypothetical protein